MLQIGYVGCYLFVGLRCRDSVPYVSVMREVCSCVILIAVFQLCGAAACATSTSVTTDATKTQMDAATQRDAALGPVGDGSMAADARAPMTEVGGDATSTAAVDAAALDASNVNDSGAQDQAAQADAATTLEAHLCALEDVCGAHQGSSCPATPSAGDCSGQDTCYYCQGLSRQPSLALSCESGRWTGSVPQPCAR
jgi:hypothetical protein